MFERKVFWSHTQQQEEGRLEMLASVLALRQIPPLSGSQVYFRILVIQQLAAGIA